jgi:hypothetical protein
MSEFDANSIVQYAGCVRVEKGIPDGVLSRRLASVALALDGLPFRLEDRKGDLVLIPHMGWADISTSTVATACRIWEAMGENVVVLHSDRGSHHEALDTSASLSTIAKAIATLIDFEEKR